MSEEAAPAGLVLLGALTDAQDLPEAVAADADGHQHRDIPDLSGPAAFENDAVQVDIRVFALDLAVSPLVDMSVDLLVPGC